MTVKRFTLVFALFALLTAAVSANDEVKGREFHAALPPHRLGFSIDNDSVLEATGLDAEALQDALMDGSTVAELIEANEGDVDSVIGEIAALMAENIDESAASYLVGLDERVSKELHSSNTLFDPWGRRRVRLPRMFAYSGVGDTILDATGLDAAGLRSALADGSTIAELIEANAGDVASVTADLVATITDAVNASAASRVESLEENISELFNTDLADRWRRGRRGHPRPRFFFGFWSMQRAPDSETPGCIALIFTIDV